MTTPRKKMPRRNLWSSLAKLPADSRHNCQVRPLEHCPDEVWKSPRWSLYGNLYPTLTRNSTFFISHKFPFLQLVPIASLPSQEQPRAALSSGSLQGVKGCYWIPSQAQKAQFQLLTSSYSTTSAQPLPSEESTPVWKTFASRPGEEADTSFIS